jgi:putative methionine-R-sulfoxide reductase with GAF domain
MPPRTLASLAHALGASADLDAAFVALAEALAEVDRSTVLALYRYDARREMLREGISMSERGQVERTRADTKLDHIPPKVRVIVTGGSQFADVGDRSEQMARLLGMRPTSDDGLLSLRGIPLDGHLESVIALYEPRRIFGTRVVERFGPYVALFELAFARFSEREARQEAVRTLEDVTQRVHGEYVKRLSELEQELAQVRGEAARGEGGAAAERLIALEADAARAKEEARRAIHRAQLVEQQVGAAVGQLEQAHIELHRRSETLREKTRTLYLIERVLGLDASTADPRQLVDELLSLVGDDMQAQRVSLMLRAPDGDHLFLAASRGLQPGILDGRRIPIGQGVAGRVAASREPILVQDVSDASKHPLLRDQYFTTGSFISFPLIYQDELVGVVNLTNRARQGLFMEEDVERVRLLALVIALVATNAGLPERLLETIAAH